MIYICIIVLYIYNTLYIIKDTYVLYKCLCFSKVSRLEVWRNHLSADYIEQD